MSIEITAAFWPDLLIAKIGEKVTMTAQLSGITEPAIVAFEVFEYSARQKEKPIKTFQVKVGKGATEAKQVWTVVHVDELTQAAGMPEYRFRASIGSHERTSRTLKIGWITGRVWDQDASSKTPKAPSGDEAQIFFRKDETVYLVLEGVGLDNYVYDFTIFRRVRGPGNAVTFPLLDTLLGVAPTTDILLRAPWSLARVPGGEQYYGEQFVFTFGFHPRGAPDRVYTTLGDVRSLIAQNLAATFEYVSAAPPIVVAGETVRYTFRVKGASASTEVQVAPLIGTPYVTTFPYPEPLHVSDADQIVIQDLPIDIGATTTSPGQTFPVYLLRSRDVAKVDEIAAPLAILEAFLDLSCPVLGPTFVDEITRSGAYDLNIALDAPPGIEVECAITNAMDLQSQNGILVSTPTLTQTTTGATVFVFRLKSLSGEGPLPGPGVIEVQASYKTLSTTCQSPFSVVERVEVEPPSGMILVKEGSKPIPFEFRFLRASSEPLDVPFDVTITDLGFTPPRKNAPFSDYFTQFDVPAVHFAQDVRDLTVSLVVATKLGVTGNLLLNFVAPGVDPAVLKVVFARDTLSFGIGASNPPQ